MSYIRAKPNCGETTTYVSTGRYSLNNVSVLNRYKVVQAEYLSVLENIENAVLIANIQSHSDRLRGKVCQLDDVLKTSCKYAANLAAGYGVQIMPPESGLGMVAGDFCLLHKALFCLLKTAVIFSEANGQIIMKAQSIPEGAALTIESHGFSIPTNELPSFFSVSVPRHTKTPIDRLGLEPFVADQIINFLGGVVVVCNLDSGGVRFHVLLSRNADYGTMGANMN